MTDVLVLSAKRTPIGSFQGSLTPFPAPELGATAIKAAVEASGVAADKVEQVIMGHVLQAGSGQAPARQAMRKAGLPDSCGAITLHKVCGSGLRAVMDGRNAIAAGEFDVVVAGGMESMSNAPYVLPKARQGYRMGHGELLDVMIHDGLWDPYNDKHMGNCAETCAKKFDFTREAQDAYALESYRRAKLAVEQGLFDNEIAAVSIPQRKADPISFARDEEPFAAPLEKMPKLRPAFDANGTVTAANASTLNDGAAALMLASEQAAKSLEAKPLVRIVAQASYGQDPEWFTTSPVEASRRALNKAGMSSDDIDCWEINEAFSLVAMAAIRELELDPARVNARGGAVALGHPIGCSGARILTTLIHTLQDEKKRYGCATICIGGGEGVALIVENVQL